MTSLNDICEFIVDCEHKTAPTTDKGFASIRTPNVGRGRLVLEGVNRVNRETYQGWTRRAVPQTNDLIIAREAPVGNIAIIRAGQIVCLGQRTVLVRPNPEKVDPEFLCYFMLGDYVQGEFTSVAIGATVPHLNMKDIRGLAIPELPDLFTQRRIASILSAYDDLSENNTRRIAILEEMARRLYEEWFVNFRFPGHESFRMIDSEIGSIPNGWKPTKLGNLASDTRIAVDPSTVSPDTPYVGLEHIPRRSFTLSGWGNPEAVSSTKLNFQRGEILFGKIRPYLHKVSIAPYDGICSSDTIVIQAKSEKWLSMVLCCTSSDQFVDHASQTSQGTKMPRANWGVLTEYPLPTPPDDLLKLFNSVVVPIVSQTRTLMFRNINLRTQRDLLLPKLISGEIDVSEAGEQLEDAAA